MQRLVHPLELTQCSANVASFCTRPDQHQVRLLVGRVRTQHVVPSASEVQEVEVRQPK
jgi:hypothetical protein